MADIIQGGVGYQRIPNPKKTSATYYSQLTGSDYTKLTRESMANVVAEFSNLVRTLSDGSVDAVSIALQPVLRLSRYYCPKKTGDLVSSGQIHVARSDKKVTGQIWYGKIGSRTLHYAPLVHERTDLNHAPPTQAKFLQAAFEQSLSTIREDLINYYKRLGRFS